MVEYQFATVSDLDALVQSRLEMLRVVNNLGVFFTRNVVSRILMSVWYW